MPTGHPTVGGHGRPRRIRRRAVEEANPQRRASQAEADRAPSASQTRPASKAALARVVAASRRARQRCSSWMDSPSDRAAGSVAHTFLGVPIACEVGGNNRAVELATRIDVLKLALHGKPNKVIARELRVSEHTVEDHLKAIFGKVGVGSRGELAATIFAERYAGRSSSNERRH